MPRKSTHFFFTAAVMTLNISSLFAQELSFTRAFPVAGNSENHIAAYATEVFVSGTEDGAAFLRTYDHDGNEQWYRPFDEASFARGIATNGAGIYMVGQTGLRYDAMGRPAGFRNGFVRSYGYEGDEMWTVRFGGNTGGTSFGQALSVAADWSGVYVAEALGDSSGLNSIAPVFLRKYDRDGNMVWTSVTLAAGYNGTRIAVDSGNVYLIGTISVDSSPQSQSMPIAAFLRKYDAAGNESWTHQFGIDAGGGYAFPFGIAATSSAIYVAGSAYGLGGNLSFIRAFDLNGEETWTTQFSGAETGSIAADRDSLYVSGSVVGALDGQISAGSQDAFVRRYDLLGNEGWTQQFGLYGDDSASDISVDAGAVYVIQNSSDPQSEVTGPAFLKRFEKQSPIRAAVCTSCHHSYLPILALTKARRSRLRTRRSDCLPLSGSGPVITRFRHFVEFGITDPSNAMDRPPVL